MNIEAHSCSGGFIWLKDFFGHCEIVFCRDFKVLCAALDNFYVDANCGDK